MPKLSSSVTLLPRAGWSCCPAPSFLETWILLEHPQVVLRYVWVSCKISLSCFTAWGVGRCGLVAPCSLEPNVQVCHIYSTCLASSLRSSSVDDAPEWRLSPWGLLHLFCFAQTSEYTEVSSCRDSWDVAHHLGIV